MLKSIKLVITVWRINTKMRIFGISVSIVFRVSLNRIEKIKAENNSLNAAMPALIAQTCGYFMLLK